ncbi:hypothetical protein GGR52DRAFT_228424 [Hypoxylon sp. FL1284]|nr:hypothetical protein GGR52DRAFT_228424 [Hypoxylon sp. FL1284]
MSMILRGVIGALALLGSGALALPHPDGPATPTPMATGPFSGTTASPSPPPPPPTTTPPPPPPTSRSSSVYGEIPFTGDCDHEFCNSLGTSVCFYWGGITGFDSMHNPRPGETQTLLGPCSMAP